MNFEETVKAMTMKEIIMAMVKGLRNPHVEVVMSTFGAQRDGVCFGCAATNTICEISGKTFSANVIDSYLNRAEFLNCNPNFLESFEISIDCLRYGESINYNVQAEKAGTALLEPSSVRLPFIDDGYSQDELDQWEEYANTL